MTRWLLKTDLPLYFPDQQLPRYQEDELIELVDEYVTTGERRNELIESQIRLTLTIASMYLSKYRTHPNELISDSLMALVRAVERFPRVRRDNDIGAYINKTIWYSLKQAVLRNKLIPIPSKTLHRKLKDGTLKPVDVVSLLSNDKATYRVDNYNRVDEEDFLNIVLKSDEDRKILKMRVARYKGKEIADELKVKVSYVWNRCRQIQQKLALELR